MAWIGALAGVLCAALALSPNTPWVRARVRVALERLLDDICQGEVHIDRIAQLSLGGVLAEGVSVRDGAGRTVLHAARLSLGLAPLALMHLELRFTHGLLEDARIRAIPSDSNAITLFDALAPTPSPNPTPSEGGLDVSFEHIHVRRAHLYGGVPGMPALEVLGLEARGEMRIVAGELAVRVTQARGVLTRPYEHALSLEQANFTLDTSPLRLSAKARVSRAADRLHAALRYRAPATGDDVLDLLLALDPVSPELLTDVHIAPAHALLSSVRGHLRLSGPLRALGLRAALTTDAGPIAIRAIFPEQAPFWLRLESPALELERLIAYAPPLELAVAVEASEDARGELALHLTSPHLALWGVALADTEIFGAYARDRLSLREAHLRYGEGSFDASGWIDADGDLSVRIRSRVPDVASDQVVRRTGVRGSLRTDVRIDKRGHLLSADGSVDLAGFSYGDFKVKELVMEGHASGEELAKAKVDVHGASWGTAYRGYPLGDFEYELRGQSPHFSADFGLIDQRARTAHAHLEVDRVRAGYRLRLAPLEVGVPGREPWRAKADVSISDEDVTFHELILANGPQHLELRGQYSFSKAYRVDATLQSFDLGGLRQLSGLDLADLDGTIDGTLALTGVPGHPKIDAKGTLRDGVFLGMQDLRVLLSLSSIEERFDVDTQIILPDNSRIALYAGGELGRGDKWLAQLAAGNYRFGVDFEHLHFEVARPWLGWLGIEPPTGAVSATIRGAGTLASPYLDVKTDIEKMVVAGWPALDVHLDAEHDGERASLHALRVSDDKGPIAELTGFIDANVSELRDPLTLRASLGQRPLEVALNWANRRLDELPGRLRLDFPIASWGSLRVEQTAQGPSVDLETRLAWPENSDGLEACGEPRHPRFELALQAHDQRTTAKFTASLDGQQLAMADADADTPIVAWLTGAQPLFLPRTGFTLNAATPASEEVPWLCEHVAGPLELSVSALDAFADPPELSLELHSGGLQLVASEAEWHGLGGMRDMRALGRTFAVNASAGFEGPNLTFRADLDEGRGARLDLSGSLPRAALFQHGPPAPDWPAAQLALTATRVELAPFLVALPPSLRGTGTVDGRAHARYDFARDQVALSGAFALNGGQIVLGSLGQQLSDVHGKLTLEDDTVHIEAVEARDFDGRLKLDGALTFANGRELLSDLSFKLKDFPIRRESAPVSRLTGSMRLRATTTTERTRAELTAGELRVNLPNDLGQGLQALDEHEDIVVRGEQVAPPAADPYVFELHVLARKPPFRVLRNDLSADVAVDIAVHYRPPDLTLQGSTEIKRGEVELYGKRFQISDSRLAFDGSETVDPLINVDAVYHIGGDEIGVHVTGRLSDPQISFSHSNPAITQPGEIIAELLGARTTDTAAQATETGEVTGAAAGVLAGVTAGLLTSEVRRQFGGVLPVLSVESSSTTLRSARIRAGVQLDQLIERRLGRLRKVVRGAYVEGFVAPGATPDAVSATAAPQSRGGGLLELRFPKDLVGTVEFRPVQNWRLDLAWEP